MRKIFNKIGVLFGVVFLFSISLMGCGGEQKSILWNDYYLTLNLDNNYDEIKILAERLDKENFDVETEINKIVITDKNSKSLDKIEYNFINNKIDVINYRSNAKNIKLVRDGIISFYGIGDYNDLVKTKESQWKYLSGNKLDASEILNVDPILVELYHNMDLEKYYADNRITFQGLKELGYVFEENDNEKTLKVKKDNHELFLRYCEKPKDDLPMLYIENMEYKNSDGKIISVETNGRAKIENLKTKLNENSEWQIATEFLKQMNFLGM